MADTTRCTHEGLYVITRCWRRYESQHAGWYRVFGAGGFWNTYLEDLRFSPGDGRPPYVGQLLTGVRLWPRQASKMAAKHVADITCFTLLEPARPGISHDELYPG
ncbi:hypothetical protein KZO25_11750 [Halomonas sp. ANAO-440]|uniref:hypothetical protein n=1 Tax=Halomonas sp. ANAO-440 TaxID=2861360 RepID=UPI001CAA6DE8|nr:hypothetical protein [Halomonas sp. ANAO-440]MBZ0330989.1 hypothetical protein [Halomonas sp. ANAO-440]